MLCCVVLCCVVLCCVVLCCVVLCCVVGIHFRLCVVLDRLRLPNLLIMFDLSFRFPLNSLSLWLLILQKKKTFF